jgi:transposase
LLDRLSPTIAQLSQVIKQEAEKCPAAQRLRTHPGVGSLTALAFVLIIGSAERFQCGKQIASYLGLVPLEESSGNRRRLGHITKQGNALLHFRHPIGNRTKITEPTATLPGFEIGAITIFAMPARNGVG